jgi:hypothetical protein
VKESLKRCAANMLLSLRTQEAAESTCERSKKRKLNGGTPKRRVSFSNAQSVVEVEPLPEEEKRNSWYAHEDYSQFVVSAHRDAQVLKSAAESATSAESLFHFIQNNPDLSPRGLEKVLHHGAEDNRNNEEPQDCASSMSLYSRKIRLLKAHHREMLLSMHRDQKQSGQHNPEELRKFSESSSQWAVQTALKLGHIDAHGLI